MAGRDLWGSFPNWNHGTITISTLHFPFIVPFGSLGSRTREVDEASETARSGPLFPPFMCSVGQSAGVSRPCQL